MKIISEKHFPVLLKKTEHYSLTLDGGILVTLQWTYTYSAGDSFLLTEKEASALRRKGATPWEVQGDGRGRNWAICTIAQKWWSMTIVVYHYGREVQAYANIRTTESDLAELVKNAGLELSIGEAVIRITRGKEKTTKIRGETFGEMTHPKEVVVQLLHTT